MNLFPDGFHGGFLFLGLSLNKLFEPCVTSAGVFFQPDIPLVCLMYVRFNCAGVLLEVVLMVCESSFFC